MAGHENIDVTNNDEIVNSGDSSGNLNQDDTPAEADLAVAVSLSNLNANPNHCLQSNTESTVPEMVNGGNEYADLIDQSGYLPDLSTNIYSGGKMIASHPECLY